MGAFLPVKTVSALVKRWYLCFFAAITAGEAAGSKCANSTRKGLLQSGPNKSAGAKGRIEPFAPALICIRGCSATYPPEQPSAAALSTRALAQAASPHCDQEEKRRVSNPLWKAYSSYFSEQLFCSVSLFTSSGACHYGWPALCQWFAAPVPAAPAGSPPPASPGTYSGNSRSRWQSCPGRRRR